MRRKDEDCKECFMRGCECECKTCADVRERNSRLTNLDLTRMSVQAGLAEAKVTPEEREKMGRMLRGMGL